MYGRSHECFDGHLLNYMYIELPAEQNVDVVLFLRGSL